MYKFIYFTIIEEINTKQNGKTLITLFIERVQIYSTLNMPPQ